MYEIGNRQRPLPAPPKIVWRSLTQPRDPRARPWLTLLDDEVEPRILEAVEPTLVVWSSLWPSRKDDLIRFELQARGNTGTLLRWILTTEDEPPDQRRTGHLRYRINRMINGDLQLSYGQ